MASFPDADFMWWIAQAAEPSEPASAPARLKAKLYSALVERQRETGLLMTLTECHERGGKLCVFEHLVRLSPVDERMKSLNICRVCHARVLAEHMDNVPIYWSGCPYVEFKKS
jgi:hypothetical protein